MERIEVEFISGRGVWSENIHWRQNWQLRAEFWSSATDAGKIPGVLGMQNVLNGFSMAVGVMEKALYSSYTRRGSMRSCI
jgi:hypothetical protein